MELSADTEMAVVMATWRGARAHRLQVAMTWVGQVTMLLLDVALEEEPQGFGAAFLLCMGLLLVTLFNTAHHVRNKRVGDELQTHAHREPSFERQVLQGHAAFLLGNGLSVVGALVAALYLAARAQDGYDHWSVAVWATLFATVNWSRALRDEFEAQTLARHSRAHQSDERLWLPLAKTLARGTTWYLAANLVSAGWAMSSALVGVATRAHLLLLERVFLASGLVFMVIMSVLAAKMLCDAPGVHTVLWQVMTSVGWVLATALCVVLPLVMDGTTSSDRLFFETHVVWVLAATLSGTKVVRDRYAESTVIVAVAVVAVSHVDTEL